MATRIAEPSGREKRVAQILRSLALTEIEKNDDLEVTAKVLGLYPSGVRTLLARGEWPLETAFRVADALGIKATNEIEAVLAGEAK